MNRYENTNILRTDTGKRYKKTTVYPIIDRNVNDTYIVSIQGDRLDNLAYKYYDDARLWWIIARANNIGKGSLAVPIGIQLRIPVDYVEIVKEYRNLNK